MRKYCANCPVSDAVIITFVLDLFIYELKKPYHFFKTGLLRALPAAIRHGFPATKLKIIAITGTDGKTTTTTLTYHLLKAAGCKVGLISTVAAYIGDEQIETGLHVTTPEPDQLQALMARMVKEGMEYLVLEFTSHGAYQQRLFATTPFLTGLTNINHEHLDYHRSYQNYLEAKVSYLSKAETVILNQDDISFFRVKKYLPSSKHTILTYSHEDSLPKVVLEAIKTRFPENYNQMNARLAITIANRLGVDTKTIAAAIPTFPGVPGRMELVPNRRRLKIIVDFAHTPQALEGALMALRRQMQKDKSNGRLIAVFGCAGLRDRQKRPMMGKIAVDHADLAVFTAEDPRTENIWNIIRQMKEQLTEGHNKIVSIADRHDAIDFAINTLAKPGDVIGIFGKGPEKSMCYGTVELPWSDREVVESCLSST